LPLARKYGTFGRKRIFANPSPNPKPNPNVTLKLRLPIYEI